MTYAVTITSASGNAQTYKCGGSSDQEALIYAGKIVEANADPANFDATISITRDGNPIGPVSSMRDMLNTK